MTESGQRASVGDRVLGAVDRFHAYLENALNLVAAVFIFFLMLLGVTEVLSRRLLGIPIPGHIDIVTLIMATFALLGAAYCQRLGGHIRMEILVSRLRGRTMWIVEAFGVVVALFIVGVLIEGSWYHFLRALQIGDSTLDIRLPTWPSKLLVPIALAVLWLRLWIQLWGYLRLVAAPDAEHLAVPETKGMVDTAREEAEAALRGATADAERTDRG